MRSILALFAFVMLFATTTKAQTLEEKTLAYLKANGTELQYTTAVDAMFTVLEKQYAGKNITAQTWQAIKQEQKQAVVEITNLLVPVYTAIFSESDIDKMLVFYKSKAAQRMVSRKQALTQKDRKALSVFFNSTTGKKIIEKRADLANKIAAISEKWSSTLYQSTIAKLDQ